MKMIITLLFEIFNQIAGITASNHFYFKLMNEKALLAPMLINGSHSTIECAAQCTLTHRFYHAQLVASVCELLTEPQLGEPIQLSHEPNTIYMCRYIGDIISIN